MSLFISVETKSNLLGSKAPNDKVMIPVDRIHKIESFGEEEGCVITYGSSNGQVERVVSSVDVRALLTEGVVDLTRFVK